jgi:putative heme utilization carrier protein HutX
MSIYGAEFFDNKKTIGRIGKENNVSELEVIKDLNGQQGVRLFGKESVKPLLDELSFIGEVLILVENGGSVFEIKSVFPKGQEGHGYYNLGKAPLSGHINIDKINNIAVTAETMFGNCSRSWRFLGQDGNSVFRVYVGRNPDKTPLKEHLELFEKWLLKTN